MSMTEGIRINDKHSFGDFGLYLKSRKIGLPEKKSIRQTVPFLNGYYDFSTLNGAAAWNERIIEYAFDVMNDNPVELDHFVSFVLDWLANVHDVDIHDDTVYGYHWHGSYNNASVDWDETGMLAEISVSFVVHPFKIADEPTEYTMTAGSYTVHNLGMVVAPYAIATSDAAIQIGNYVSTMPANEKVKLQINLVRGDNTVIVTGDGTVRLGFYEEVL